MNTPSRCCPICDASLIQGGMSWVQQCPRCGFLCSTLSPKIDTDPGVSAIDESYRATALAPVRQANFARIFELLRTIDLPRAGKLLDVGCGHGWFLKAAAEQGFRPHGIEPDPAISRLAQQTGFPVWTGYFPNDLPPQERFDVVIFNDVFEHLPDVRGMMQACHELLTPDGALVINLPVSTGIFYRLATWLMALGVRKPFERMWQKEFPSPHLSYFRPRQLEQLAARHGFQEIVRGSLPSVQSRGLWQRLCYDRTGSRMSAALLYGGLLLGLPVIRLLPSDISVQVFRKAPGNAGREAA